MKKTITVLILLCLLSLSSIYVAFAYFVTPTGEVTNPNETPVKSNRPINATLKYTDIEMPNPNPIYPGTMNYTIAQVVSGIDQEMEVLPSITTEYTIEAQISLYKGNSSSSFDNPIKYTMYETQVLVDNPLTCNPVDKTPAGILMYHDQNCYVNATYFNQDTKVSEGIINNGVPTIIAESNKRSILTGQTRYFYLFVEYLKQDYDQSSDEGKEIRLGFINLKPTRTYNNSIKDN